MKKPLILLIAAAGALALTGCAEDYGYGNRGYGYENGRNVQHNRGQHNRRGKHMRHDNDRYLGANDRIYRDKKGNYYCKRDDGTTGAIVGAVGGGVLGNIIAPGGSKTLGTILGAGGGLLAGRAIDRNDVRCR